MSIVVILALGAASLSTEAPVARTEALIVALKKVAPLPQAPTDADLATREQQFAELDTYFDLDTLVTDALAPRAAALTPAELTRLRQSFRAVLRKAAYGMSGDAFRKGQLAIEPLAAKSGGQPVRVKVSVPAEDTDHAIDFVWRPVGGTLKVVDVRLEGDSLVKDYQNQVARLIDKGGAAALQMALDKKQAAVDRTPR